MPPHRGRKTLTARTPQTMTTRSSPPIPMWRPASLFEEVAPNSTIQHERSRSTNRTVSPFDCALHNSQQCAQRQITPRHNLSQTEDQEPDRNQARPNMRHDLSTLCLLPHTYRHICNICARCHSRTIVEYSPPWCASGTDTGPLLIGNIPADEAPALPAPVRL